MYPLKSEDKFSSWKGGKNNSLFSFSFGFYFFYGNLLLGPTNILTWASVKASIPLPKQTTPTSVSVHWKWNVSIHSYYLIHGLQKTKWSNINVPPFPSLFWIHDSFRYLAAPTMLVIFASAVNPSTHTSCGCPWCAPSPQPPCTPSSIRRSGPRS